jgi:hypothetical protein
MKTTHIPFWPAQLFIAALSVSGAYPVYAQQGEPSATAIPVIQMSNAPLGQAIDLLARQSALNYIVDPHLSDNSQTVSFAWTNVTAREGLNRLLKEHDLVLVENTVTSVARIAPASLHVKPVEAAQLGKDTNAAVPVVMMTGYPLGEAIDLLAKELHRKSVIDKAVYESLGQRDPLVTVRWQNLTPKQALVALLDAYDLIMVDDPAVPTIRIMPKQNTSPKAQQ